MFFRMLFFCFVFDMAYFFWLGAYGGVGIQWFIPVILVYHARK